MVVTQLTEIGEETTGRVRLKVVGVGGCGCNALDRMIRQRISGVDFVAINTDAQALNHCLAETKLQIGQRETRGLGAGGCCEIGHRSAEESMKEIEEILSGSHMVFIAAGMGGGTGTGASPTIAKVAHDAGAITVGVVTSPFEYEGTIRNRQAESGIEDLRREVDTLIVIPNDRLHNVADPDSTIQAIFDMANDVLLNAVDGICSLISTPGLINRDFQDVKTVITKGGGAMIGTGRASGSSRATEAAREAISGPLLEGVSIEGATALLVHFQASAEARFTEMNEAMRFITATSGMQAHVFMGASIDESLGDEMKITVIATGFGQQVAREPEEVFLPSIDSGISFPSQRAARIPESPSIQPMSPGPKLETREKGIPTFLRKTMN
jgi:cell division protein FtsZ